MSVNNKKGIPKIIVILLVLLQIVIFVLGYAVGYNRGLKKNINVAEKATEKTTIPIEEPIDMTDEELTEKILSEMTLDEMIYQMMFVTPESITNIGVAVAAGDTTKQAINDYPVGGLVYFSNNFESREQTIEMISNTQSYSKIPLFIGVDEEGGRVSRLGSNPDMGTTKQPPMREIGDAKDASKAYEVGKTLAEDLSALGFNVDFAPDSDVIINKNNTEIGDRSFGEDAANVALMVENVVKGLEENGVSATLKHFPGHGSTYNNSHTGYSESTRTLDEMRNCEFLPFVSGIKAEVDFIMVSHMTPVNATEEKVPASVSKEIITDVLKTELGYSGIVITDAFNMGAVTEKYTAGEAAVKAVKAGVDMILMTPDLNAAHSAIKEAVNSGEITEERIVESVRKIIALKVEKGMFEG